MSLRALAMASGLMLTTLLYAQQQSTTSMSAAEVLKQAQKGASDVEQLRAALQSPDPSTRLTTMKAMLDSNNAALVTMAINQGNASSDADLRNLAVRAAFREVTGFTPQPANPLQDEAAKMYSSLASFTSGLKIQITGYNQSQGYFQGYGNLRGQVSYGRLEFQTNDCTAVLLSKDGSWRFEGRVDCRYNNNTFSEALCVQLR